jgi:hypothetical protein
MRLFYAFFEDIETIMAEEQRIYCKQGEADATSQCPIGCGQELQDGTAQQTVTKQ